MCKAQFVFCLLVVISYATAASLESVGGSSAQHDDGNTGLPLGNLTDPQLKTTTLNRFVGDDSSTKKSLKNQNDEADDNDDDDNVNDESEEEENEDDDDDYDESRPKSKNIDEDDPASYDSTYDDTDK